MGKYIGAIGLQYLWNKMKSWVTSNFPSLIVNRGANTFLAAPNGSDGAATFRTISYNDIPKGTEYREAFTKRQTANGQVDLSSGLAFLREIRGNTIVWNQIIPSPAGSSSSSGTSSYTLLRTFASGDMQLNHKYYFTCGVKFTTDYVCGGSDGFCFTRTGSVRDTGSVLSTSSVPRDNEWHRVNGIMVCGKSDDTYLHFYAYKVTSGTFSYKDKVLFDLTRMFGVGNEPTANEFDALFPLYSYLRDTGRLINFTGESLASMDGYNNTIGIFNLNINLLTGKLNGEGSSISVFPNGMRSAGSAYDVIEKEDEQWWGIVNVGSRAYNSSTDDSDTDIITDKITTNYPLSASQRYLLDDEAQNNLNEICKVEEGGMEIILPENQDEPLTSPAVMSIYYGTDLVDSVSELITAVPSIKQSLTNYQLKLTAGTNITIDSNNVISATGGGGGTTQIQVDWTQSNTSAVDYIKNKPTLSTVATSGNYTDLVGAPQYVICTLSEYEGMASHDSNTYYIIIEDNA